MTQGTLKIHSENILPIIKKWLYSDKDIFVRELVSNACDAIHKLKVLADQGETKLGDDSFSIALTIDKEKRRLTFSDNGIGMEGEEVEKYIAQLAFSGAEEFVQKYTSEKEEDQIIGHFGLGFYSAYMVAKSVTIQTLSFKDGAAPVEWVCDGGVTYTLEEGTRTTRGTDIILTLNEEEEEYLDPAHLRKILEKYCAFLPYPISLNGSPINEKPPLWIKSPSECTDMEYLDFYRLLFPMQPDPLFWVHLNVDYPFHVRGILYFPRLSNNAEWQKESIKLFCNRVFVSDSCKDLLPNYLTILRGALDSPDIPLNVSRSTLQMNKTVRQLGGHISKKISDRLLSLYRDDREAFLSYWEDIELIIKYGALQDEKFYDRIKEILLWKDTEGKWRTAEEMIAGKEEKTIYYTPHEGHAASFLSLYKEKNIEVLCIQAAMLDTALMQLIEQKTGATFQRIDSKLSETILDPEKEKSLLDADGRSGSAKTADLFRKKLGEDHLEIEAKSLASSSLPCFLMLSEEGRRLRDHLTAQNNEMASHSHALVKPTLVVNTNSKLIQGIEALAEKKPELARELACEVYDLARLSQHEISSDALITFIERTTSVLEKLISE